MAKKFDFSIHGGCVPVHGLVHIHDNTCHPLGTCTMSADDSERAANMVHAQQGVGGG